MKYKIKMSAHFKRDLKLARKQGKNIDKLNEVVNIIARGEKLDIKYRDHGLGGYYEGYRECHIEPDWLLVYKLEDDVLILLLYRISTHSELFNK
ncbi:MAG: type II toxin-antitoxin system YafQ family toxin [Clostridiales bacterium]|nr:type II toxin-antitoxin system YafQ family toxin [Clostridiales bacterium]